MVRRHKPIPVCGVAPSTVRPSLEILIPLYWEANLGINWQFGEPVTKAQLELAIIRSSNQQLPNELLPSLCPGDVVLLQEGKFWITADWEVEPL